MKFNNLIEVRDYLETIPEDKYIKRTFSDINGNHCTIGHIAVVLEESEDRDLDAILLLDRLGKNNDKGFAVELETANDDAENPKQAVIELLNQRIYDLAN